MAPPNGPHYEAWRSLRKPGLFTFLGSDGKYHIEGSFLGSDGKYHPKGSFIGVHGCYEEPEGLARLERATQRGVDC